LDICGDANHVLNPNADWINCEVPGDETRPMHVMGTNCTDMGGTLDDEAYSCLDVWMWTSEAVDEGRLDEAGAVAVASFWRDKCCAMHERPSCKTVRISGDVARRLKNAGRKAKMCA